MHRGSSFSTRKTSLDQCLQVPPARAISRSNRTVDSKSSELRLFWLGRPVPCRAHRLRHLALSGGLLCWTSGGPDIPYPHIFAVHVVNRTIPSSTASQPASITSRFSR